MLCCLFDHLTKGVVDFQSESLNLLKLQHCQFESFSFWQYAVGDADEWIRFYNEERTHQGKFCFGKTPMQTLKDTLHLAKEKYLEKKFEPEKKQPESDRFVR